MQLLADAKPHQQNRAFDEQQARDDGVDVALTYHWKKQQQQPSLR